MYLTAEEAKMVDDIIRFYIPEYEVRAFGSRVTGKNLKKFSDLDIVIMTDTPLPTRKWAQVKDAFMLSYLEFRVDVLDWSYVSPEFRAIIEGNYEVLYKPAGNAVSAG